ncbi:MAG: coproporphyrinogen dehydrogenase HemZ, partial [Lachnospiraceae bacterium]|nr:coproporphyrinogen dehydrogenase HemZ [Lachnospiraceae bacterium]
MYRIKILHFEKTYLLNELIKIFLQPDQYELTDDTTDSMDDADCIVFNEAGHSDINQIKREIYDTLSKLTGQKPEWGILTGVRPVKLCGETYELLGDADAAVAFLMENYYLCEEKARLIMDMYLHQQEFCGIIEDKSACVYVGIPFCPTRCVYCSFASNQVPDAEIARYLEALLKEVKHVGKRMKETGIVPETIYIGGGTPTTLNAGQLDVLIETMKTSFDMSKVKEFTIEAGRPDTITEDKLSVIAGHGITRISINPQSMKARTLELIGRSHEPEDIEKAFAMAKAQGFDNINADIIAGLPEESVEDFVNTLTKVIELDPESITVHCLAVKRASKLIEQDPGFHYKQAELVADMLAESRRILAEAGYEPYYLYRQKHMAGAFENVGYCKKDKDCIYNVRIMDEHQINMALGAGGISKMYYPEENRLERVPNVTNYQEYINRIDEMLDRKEK